MSLDGGRDYYSNERLRSAALFFLSGKALTAPLSFVILYLLGSQLPEADFAVFIWLMAFGRFTTEISYFGINWTALNFVPYYRATARTSALRIIIIGMCVLRFLVLLVFAAMCLLAAPNLLTWFGDHDWLSWFRIYIYIMIFESFLYFINDCILPSLLRYGTVYFVTFMRHLAFIGVFLYLRLQDSAGLPLADALYALATATAVALALSLALLGWLLSARTEVDIRRRGNPPSLRRFVSIGANNYAHDLVSLSGGGSVLIMIGGQLLDASALAMIGLALAVTEQLSRVLPSQMSTFLLRPKLISSYAINRDPRPLRDHAVLLGKVTSIEIALCLSMLAAYGPILLGILFGEKYSGADGVLLILMMSMLLVGWQRILVIVANTVERSEFVRRASYSAFSVVPLVLVFGHLGLGAYGFALAMVCGKALYVVLLVSFLRRAGFIVALDLLAHLRIFAAGAAAYGVGLGVSAVGSDGMIALTLGVTAMLLSFGLALRLLHPFNGSERRSIERLVGRPLTLVRWPRA